MTASVPNLAVMGLSRNEHYNAVLHLTANIGAVRQC